MSISIASVVILGMLKEKKPITLLSFDFGMKKIGVAVGQSITQTATPLTELPAQDGIPSWDVIASLLQTWGIHAIVVGLPYNMDGSDQEITRAAKKFGNRLHDRFQKPVYFVDERLTTVEAKSHLRHPSKSVDRYAAKLILEAWFREQHDDQKN